MISISYQHIQQNKMSRYPFYGPFSFHANEFADPFYDPFFHGRHPRKTIEGKDNSEGKVVPRNFFEDSLDTWRKFEDFGQWDDKLEVKEEADKYRVIVKDGTAQKKDLDVNYHKQQNELQVNISHKYESNDGESRKVSSSSSSTFSVSFEKAVKPNEISAEVGPEGVQITVPKMEADQENVVSIEVTKKDSS